MTSGFMPQALTMNSYSKIERTVYDDFRGFGYNDVTAMVIAHSFTQYVLGYADDDKVINNIMDIGETEEFAKSVLDSFRQARDAARPAYVQRSEKRMTPRETIHG